MSPLELEYAGHGRADALADIARRRPRIAYIGSEFSDTSALDAETGLTRFSVSCCKSREKMAYCAAYNEVIDDARGRGELEGMTFAGRAMTREAVDAAASSGPARELSARDPPWTPSGAACSLEVTRSEGRLSSALWHTDAATGNRLELRVLGGDAVRLVVVGSSPTLVVRDDAARLSATFDLASGLPLQVFPDAPRE